MPWLKLILESTEELAPDFDDLLIELGAVAVTLTDNADHPLFEPPPGTTPLWNQTRIEALFEFSTDMDVVTHLLKNHIKKAHPEFKLIYKIEALEDQQWEKVCMDDFKPMCFGNRLWIYPSWSKKPDKNITAIKLDPGLAFGTGTHPTTAMCLEWLDAENLKEKNVLDFGCGSGVLAIAAGLLDSQKVIAIDNDPQALIATRDNLKKNHLEKKVGVYGSEEFNQQLIKNPASLPFTKADLLIANILAGPLQQLAETLINLVKPGGKIVLSGILDQQKEDLMTTYAPSCQFLNIQQKEEWCLLEATLKS